MAGKTTKTSKDNKYTNNKKTFKAYHKLLSLRFS